MTWRVGCYRILMETEEWEKRYVRAVTKQVIETKSSEIDDHLRLVERLLTKISLHRKYEIPWMRYELTDAKEQDLKGYLEFARTTISKGKETEKERTK